jgi:hypothetical protein
MMNRTDIKKIFGNLNFIDYYLYIGILILLSAVLGIDGAFAEGKVIFY